MIELNPYVIGEKLKHLREERGLSHERLAEELQKKYGRDLDSKKPISIDSLKAYEVSRIEHSKSGNQRGMKLENFIMLANFYNVSMDYLLGIEEEKSHDMNYVCKNTKLNEKTVMKLKQIPEFAYLVNYIASGWLPYMKNNEINELFGAIEKYLGSDNVNSRESAMDMLNIQEQLTSLKCSIHSKEKDPHKRLL